MTDLTLHTIEDYQKLIDQSIRHLGGYWRTLSGLARVTEELGELAELLLTEEKDPDTVGGELADVFIISTCLANQFATDLTKEYAELGLPALINELDLSGEVGSASFHFLQLSQTAGSVARIINHYDGDKPMKVSEEQISVGKQLALFHQHLFQFAAALETNLFKYVGSTLAKNLQRDKNRFALTSDPVTEKSVSHYCDAMNLENTPFKQGFRLWGAKPWDNDQSIQENLNRFNDSIQRFVKCAAIEGLDGFVLETPKQTVESHQIQLYIDEKTFSVMKEESNKRDFFIIRYVER